MTQPTKNRIIDALFQNIRIISLLFLFVVVFGTIAFVNLDRQGFPEVNLNMAIVTAPYPNASAREVEEQVVKPIEAVLQAQESVTTYESTASDNMGMIVVTFDESADLNAVISDVKEGLSGVTFPEDALDVDVTKISISGPAFTIGVSGPTETLALYESAQEVKTELEDVEGVKVITWTNAPTPEIVLTFKEEALAKYKLTREGVEAALQTAQFSAPVGVVKNEDGDDLFVSLAKEVESVEELCDLHVGNGATLADVADVEVVMNNNDRYNRVGFRSEEDGPLHVSRAIMLNVTLESDADILTVDETLRDTMETLETEERFADVDVTMFYNQADDTRIQIEEMTASVFGENIEALGAFGFIGYLFGGVTIVLVLLFCLMNARIAILTAISIPLSVITTSMVLTILGIQLNTLVLFAFVLAIGLVVDPTIVFLESLQRYKEQGMTGKAAAGKTMNTVGWGMTLAVATHFMVFIPFGIVSGFFGEIIKYIPATVIPAMIASLLIPVVFLVPFGSRFLKPRKNLKLDPNVDPELQGTWKIATKTGALISRLLQKGKARGFLRFVIVLLSFTMPFAIPGALIASGALELVQFSDGGGESDYVVISGDLDDDMNFDDAVYDVVVPLQDVLTKYPEIKTFQYYEQFGNDFMMFVTLYDLQTRKDNGWRLGPQFVNDVTADVNALHLDGDITVETSAEGPPDASSGVQVRLFDRDVQVLRTASDDVVAFLQGIDGVEEVHSNFEQTGTGGSVTLVLDNTQVMAQNPMLVYGMLGGAIAQTDLGTLTFDGVDYNVESAGLREKSTLASLRAMVLPDMQTVGDVLKEERSEQGLTIRRLDGKRYVQISADVADDADVFAIQSELDAYLDEAKLTSLGLDESAKDFAGAADSITKSFTELLMALVIAICMIYVMLVWFFRSFFEPFIILCAIPLGLIGVAISLAVTVGQVGFLELLGVVAMAGIVVNVTILIIDFANQLRDLEGKSAEEAIATSVAVRFRPIMLTQMTAFGSLMPLMVYSPFWKGLAGAIIFGIISSAILSLFLTPILYVWASKVEGWPAKIAKRLGRA